MAGIPNIKKTIGKIAGIILSTQKSTQNYTCYFSYYFEYSFDKLSDYELMKSSLPLHILYVTKRCFRLSQVKLTIIVPILVNEKRKYLHPRN